MKKEITGDNYHVLKYHDIKYYHDNVAKQKQINTQDKGLKLTKLIINIKVGEIGAQSLTTIGNNGHTSIEAD